MLLAGWVLTGCWVQYSFSYMYYMMSEPTGISHQRYLQLHIDMSRDKAIDSGELRLLAIKIWPRVDEKMFSELFWRVTV